MRTVLTERHQPRFAGLTPEQTCRVWHCVCAAWPEDLGNPAEEVSDPALLFEICRGAGLDHARVVLALAREHDAVGRGAIECLVGRPIACWAPAVVAPLPSPAPAAVPPSGPPAGPYAADARVVRAVAPGNPHRPGTTAHADYARWRVGRTLAQHVAAGMSRRALRRGLRMGWVEVVT